MKSVAVALTVAGIGAAALLAWPRPGAGQAAPPDYFPMTTRNLKLVIAYTPEERKNIRQVQLFASRDQGQTWALEATATPDKEFFPYHAKDDGIYWFNMVVVYTDGTKDPADVTRAADPQKLLVDATPPVVRVTAADRAGDEVAVEWSVEEKYPNPGKTRLAHRPVGGTDADWKDVPLAGPDQRSAKFAAPPGGVLVRVTAEDLAGNVQTATREVGAVTTSGFLAPVDPTKPTPAPPAAPAPAGGPIAPPALDTLPPPAPAPVVTPVQPTPPPGPPAPVLDLSGGNPQPTAVGPTAGPVAAPPAVAPVSPPPAEAPAAPQPTPIAVGSGTGGQPVSVPGQAELPPVQAVNFTRFELPYQVEAGLSGVKQIDLYVTRDDGRTWAKWSQHDGKEAPLRVNLQPAFGQRPDGRYGLKFVPVSGAGLSDEPPRPGTAPDFRVLVDTVPPIIKIFRPEADPQNRNALVLVWSVTDENLGKDPVALEWSESPTGPWRSVVGSDGVLPVAGGPTAPPRIANTGRYSWVVPGTLPSHLVYLKVSAWDAAGNKSEVATQEPIQVDLTKPRIRVQAIQPTPTRP